MVITSGGDSTAGRTIVTLQTISSSCVLVQFNLDQFRFLQINRYDALKILELEIGLDGFGWRGLEGSNCIRVA